jgi:hypothetical protein
VSLGRVTPIDPARVKGLAAARGPAQQRCNAMQYFRRTTLGTLELTRGGLPSMRSSRPGNGTRPANNRGRPRSVYVLYPAALNQSIGAARFLGPGNVFFVGRIGLPPSTAAWNIIANTLDIVSLWA